MQIEWKSEWKPLAWMLGAFILLFYLPIGLARFDNAVFEALHLVKWYAREHVILCLVPAFFIAGAIAVFVSQNSVMKYLGPASNKFLAYGVSSVSGSVLAVCSCTILPLFSGIYRMGAGLGPATAFLYSGPAINILAIILTARILGLEIGIARAVGAVGFSVIIGLIMHFIYRGEETEKAKAAMALPEPEVKRPLWQNSLFFAIMIAVLVFANWGSPNDYSVTLSDGRVIEAAVMRSPENPAAPGARYIFKTSGGEQEGAEIIVPASEVVSMTPRDSAWASLWKNKWAVTSVFSLALGIVLMLWFGIAWWKLLLAGLPSALLAVFLPSGGLWVLLPFSAGIIALSVVLSTGSEEGSEWLSASWDFAKQIMPLLLFGVLIAGFLLGRPDHEGIIPGRFVEMLVGARPDTFLSITGLSGGGLESSIRMMWPLWTNFFASVFGAFMYFATLTEVPILQGLIGSGMGKGPALALLLAGPALSLPNMLVIRSVMGTQKTVVFVSLVVVMATISGMIFGTFF